MTTTPKRSGPIDSVHPGMSSVSTTPWICSYCEVSHDYRLACPAYAYAGHKIDALRAENAALREVVEEAEAGTDMGLALRAHAALARGGTWA